MGNNVCNSCGFSNNPDVAFCAECGNRLQKKNQKNKDNKRRCLNGHIMDSDWEVCAWCGGMAVEARNYNANQKTAIAEDIKTVLLDPAGKPQWPTQGQVASEDMKTVLLNPIKAQNIHKRSMPDRISYSSVTGHNKIEARKKTELIRPVRQKTMIIEKGKDRDLQQVIKPRLVGFLVSYTEDPQGKSYELREGRQIIGTDSNSDIQLHGDGISIEHAVILYRRGRFIIEDRMSTNGTFLNQEELIGQKELHPSDIIEIGAIKLIVVKIEGKFN
jgi:hypothetical protein